jgi:hypothetical protein
LRQPSTWIGWHFAQGESMVQQSRFVLVQRFSVELPLLR